MTDPKPIPDDEGSVDVPNDPVPEEDDGDLAAGTEANDA